MVPRPGIKQSPRAAYNALFAASFTSIFLTLGVELIPTGGIPGTVVQKLINLISESLILLLPYWLLPRRLRGLILLPVLTMPLLILSAVWYMRFWGDLPPLSTLLVVSNFNAETVRSSLALWRIYDLIPVVAAITTTVLYFSLLRKGAESYKPTLRLRLRAIIASFALYFLHLSFETIYQMRYRYRSGEDVHITDFPSYFKTHFETEIWMNLADLRDNGFVLSIHHHICNTISVYNVRRDLTDTETLEIDRYIKAKKLEPILNDSLLASNRQKNVIIIIVESLNSAAITPVTAPTLSTLIQNPGTVSALNIMPQITVGCSGDGQLLANTGLLPLTSISTAFAVGSRNTFPGLPRLLNRHDPTAVFTDNGTPWNEANTFANYGFKQILTNQNYESKYRLKGLDRALMEVADSLLTNLQQPFLLELVTGSMHAPFNDKDIPESLINQSITAYEPLEQAYLRMVNYFDAAVDYLIGCLKARHLLDNTMIILVSDHTTNAYLNTDDPVPTMTFIATNTGITKHIDRQAMQSDIFPTILQLCGAANSEIWNGVGNSLFGTTQTPENQQQAAEISGLIIRGDYFSSKFDVKK